jgi:hypothetical protein
VAVPSSTPVGPPVPYWPSVVVKPDTISGVQTYYVNLILDIIFGAFALTVGVSSILLATSNPTSPLAAVAVIGSASCGLVIVFVINFIVALMSVIRMHHGAKEYGPDHAKNAGRGVLFKWIGTTLSTLAAILVVYLLFVGTSVFLNAGTVPVIVFVPLLVTVFWTAGVGSKAQMYRFMVRSLQPPETRRWSDIASVLIPCLGVIGIAVVGYFTVRVLDVVANPSSITTADSARLFTLMVGGVFLPPGLALVGYVMFLWIYAKTKDRLSQGLIQLYAAVPPPMAWVAAVPPPAPPNPVLPTPAPAASTACPKCGFASASTALFCVNCGALLKP